MKPPKKYRKGSQIKSLDELYKILSNGREYVYTRDSLTHPGWFLSYQFRYACSLLKKGFIYKAELTDEYKRYQDLCSR